MENFQSFSEDLIPRVVPQPMLHPVLDMSKPTVPEVSLIFDDSKLSDLKKNTQPKSYKEWKQQQQKPSPKQQEPMTKLIQSQTPPLDRKKIVTFDLPMEAHPDKKLLPQPNQSTPLSACQQLDLSLCEPKKIINNARHSIPVNFMAEMQCKQPEYNHTQHHYQDKRMQMTNNYSDVYKRTQMHQTTSNQTNFNQNPTPAKDVTLNEIYQLLQNMQVNNATKANNQPFESDRTNVQNYGMQQQQQQPTNDMPLVAGRFDSPSNIPYSVSGEPTMRDLFNVVLRQQEQLFNIQNQVHMLLMRPTNTSTKQLEAHYNHQNVNANSNQNEIDAPKKHVGVMTSLEINVQKYNANAIRTEETSNAPDTKQLMASNQKVKECGCACNCDAGKDTQSSESSSNDDNFDASPNQSESQTGWTFYGNILDQVNDVLQNTSPGASSKQNENLNPNIGAANIENRYDYSNENATSRPNIRTTQFKQVGFQIDDVNISGMSKSMLMNALAMKYLPCDLNNSQSTNAIRKGVNKTTSTRTTASTTPNGVAVKRQSEQFDGKNMNTDMSITTYRYMEKYGLLNQLNIVWNVKFWLHSICNRL